MASILVSPLTHAAASPLFVAAVIFSAWFGGTGPGVVAIAAATMALDSVMAPAHRSFSLSSETIASLCVFVLVALFVSTLDGARRRAETHRAHAFDAERAARAEAEAANLAKDEFVTMVAHELRTPLTAIRGWSATLASARVDAERRARAVEAVQRNAELQARIIEDLVDLSRVARGQVSLHKGPVDLGAVVLAAVDAMEPTATARGIRLGASLARGGAWLHGDGARLQQVVSNLLANAVKHSDPEGRVDVDLRIGGGYAHLVVRDKGRGIEIEFLPHVFDAYRQGPGESAHVGLGLGLAIVRRFVELHGGRVEAASEGPGRGSCFTVTLPLVDAMRASVADFDTGAIAAQGNGVGQRIDPHEH